MDSAGGNGGTMDIRSFTVKGIQEKAEEKKKAEKAEGAMEKKAPEVSPAARDSTKKRRAGATASSGEVCAEELWRECFGTGEDAAPASKAARTGDADAESEGAKSKPKAANIAAAATAVAEKSTVQAASSSSRAPNAGSGTAPTGA